MNVSIHKDKKHSLTFMFRLVINHPSDKTARKNFLPYRLHIDAVLLFDQESLPQVKPHLHLYIYNIHILQIYVKHIPNFFTPRMV